MYLEAFHCVKGAENFVLWGNSDLMDYYVAQGDIDSYTAADVELRDRIDFEQVTLLPFRGTSDNLVGFTARFRTCFCSDVLSETEFDYSFSEHDPIGITKCIYCN